jgi:hypothetical protein
MLNILLSKIPATSSIALNYDSKIKVKKYGFKIITNFNEQQISNLEKKRYIYYFKYTGRKS